MTTQAALQTDPAWRGEAPLPGPRSSRETGGTGRGQWPRMINLDDDTEKRLVEYLQTEIRQARLEKEPLVDDWAKWQKQYWATPKRKIKNFPFRRAANIVVPLTAIAVEAVHARIMNTIFSVEPFWSIRPKSPEWIEAAKPTERWLQTEVENENSLSVYEMANESLMELCILGTCVGKSGYEKEIRKTLRVADRSEDEEEIFRTVKDGSTLDYVPAANFLMRIAETDPNDAAWVGEEHSFTWAQIKRMTASGRMDKDAIDGIKDWFVDRASSGQADPAQDYQEEVDEHAKTEPIWHQEIRVCEVWMGFDVDGDGWDEEIIIDFHEPSGTILSARYNWYDDLHRPYRLCRYVVVPGRWPGIGIGKQNEQFQDEITTIHRQRLDNGTMANMRMLAIRKTSQYGPDEPIFPGKTWFLEDPSKDIAAVQMSEIYPSGFGNEEATLRYSEKRTGVNEVLLGMPQQGTPGTATDTLARIEEGSKRFSLVIKNVRRWFSLLGQDVLANYQQFGAGRRHFTILGEQGQWVEEILRLPQEMVMHGAVVELTATDSAVNRQVEQQQWMSLFQVITNYYAQVLEKAQIITELTQDPTQFLQIAGNAMVAADEAMRRLLETFDIVDVDRLLLTSEKEMPNEGPAVADRGAGAGGVGGLSRLAGQTGLEGLAAGLGGNGGGPSSPGIPFPG